MQNSKSGLPWSAPFLAVLVGICAGCTNFLSQADQRVSDCDNTREEIVELSEKDRASNGFAILKMYDPVEVSRTDTELKCKGRASWSDGDETSINYRSYLDSEGERFVQFEIPD